MGLIPVRSYKGKALNLALVVFLAVGCLGPRVPDEHRPFFQLPRKTQVAELTTRPLEEQLDLYIAGITGVRPPRTDLGLVIGKQGPVIVPALLTRIRRVPNEHIKANLVWIMVGMPCTTENADSMGAALDSMRLEAARMRNPNAKGSAEHSLRLAQKRCHPSEVRLHRTETRELIALERGDHTTLPGLHGALDRSRRRELSLEADPARGGDSPNQ